MENSQYWIKHLQLIQHPEGGYYKETYRSPNSFEPAGFSGQRNYSTSILFLLEKNDVSHFHSILSDEIWYYQYGDPLEVLYFDHQGNLVRIVIGPDLASGQQLQGVVPAGVIFGSRSLGSYSLVGCMVAPGFDFQDFKLHATSELLSLYPEHEVIIKQMSKEW